MTIYQPSIEIYPHLSVTTPLKRIEEIGRVCYKSEEKIKEGTAEPFVAGIIKRGHESVLEHAFFCLELSHDDYYRFKLVLETLEENAGFNSFLCTTNLERSLISGNARAWRDFFTTCVNEGEAIPGCCKILIDEEPVLFGEWATYPTFTLSLSEARLVDTSTLTDYTERMVHHRVTVKFICDRGVSHEFVRHRVASISQESTRYCNYSGDLGVIDIATAFNFEADENAKKRYEIHLRSQRQAEENYAELIALGAKPDEARSVLTNATKTEVVLTMSGEGWYNFCMLRTSRGAHPQARELAEMLNEHFKSAEPAFAYNDAQS